MLKISSIYIFLFYSILCFPKFPGFLSLDSLDDIIHIFVCPQIMCIALSEGFLFYLKPIYDERVR